MITDFGVKIHGAAKDRWQQYRLRLDLVGAAEVPKRTLAEIFPEPNYLKEIEAGASSYLLSFIRAARESIPRKPAGNSRDLVKWSTTVLQLRQICCAVLDGEISDSALRARMESRGDADTFHNKIKAYERCGHERSLRDFEISSARYRALEGVDYDPPQLRWVCKNVTDRSFFSAASLDGLLDKLAAHLEDHAPAPRTAAKKLSFSIYRYKNDPREFWIGKKVGGSQMDLKSFGSHIEARTYLTEHFDRLVEIYEKLRADAPERGEENASRKGPDRRNGRDISPDEFMTTFNFRGVQFGNYVEGPRRQEDLNNAYDALLDLSDALGVQPDALSLDGRLGLAFGARGRGGKNGAAAHYEPMQTVINLTKRSGAGSLAHEWLHAHDNIIGRLGGGLGAMATSMGVGAHPNLTWEDRRAIDAYGALKSQLRGTGIPARSAHADKFRSAKYYSEPCEMAARSFEAWVIDRLDQMGIRNDYLANIISPKVFELIDGDLRRYPYPLENEMPQIRTLFARVFAADGALSYQLGGSDPTICAPRNVTDETTCLSVTDCAQKTAPEKSVGEGPSSAPVQAEADMCELPDPYAVGMEEDIDFG